MKEIVASSRFKKDIKRFKSRPERLKKLYNVVNILLHGESLPEHYKPHMLSGEYKGYMECHIENDTLLIWIDENENLIRLIRFGSHSELFR